MVYKYQSGLWQAGSYQASGKPFASGSIDATSGASITFPFVTRWVQIYNNNSDFGMHPTNALSCSFSERGLNITHNYFVVNGGDSNMMFGTSGRLEVKCGEMFFSGSTTFSIVAGLTDIETNQIPNNWSGSVGVDGPPFS